MSETSSQIAVIGAGLGGLAAACTLAARGHKVSLFEKNPWPGGKAAVLNHKGFHFDMGPTILTMPRVLERIFEEAGENLHDQVELIRLDPQWRCFFHDQTVLDLVEDEQAMREKIESFSGNAEDPGGYTRFLADSKRLREISDRFFFWKSVQDLKDTFDLRRNLDLKTLSDVIALRMGKSAAGMIRSYVRDPKIAQMLDHFTQYVGSSPFLSPAVLCAIADIQTGDGVWYPAGGIGEVPAALENLGRRLGVEFHYEKSVSRILVDGGCVWGLQTGCGQTRKFDAVVSNMDALGTYKELFTEADRTDFQWKRTEPACSGVVFYLGLEKAYNHLLHHNFVFSENAREEFDTIYVQGEPAPDPTCYLAAPGKSDPTVCPGQGEALYILVHVPWLRPHHDWKKLLPTYRETVFNKLAATAGMHDLESRIVFESHLTPDMIRDRYRVDRGAIYGLASHGRYMGAFKPGNKSRAVDGLYLCGGAAHPGPGMPMVMMSGWIAADALDKDRKRH